MCPVVLIDIGIGYGHLCKCGYSKGSRGTHCGPAKWRCCPGKDGLGFGHFGRWRESPSSKNKDATPGGLLVRSFPRSARLHRSPHSLNSMYKWSGHACFRASPSAVEYTMDLDASRASHTERSSTRIKEVLNDTRIIRGDPCGSCRTPDPH